MASRLEASVLSFPGFSLGDAVFLEAKGHGDLMYIVIIVNQARLRGYCDKGID